MSVRKVVTVLLILSLLAQTTPAVNVGFMTKANELKTDLLFSLGSSPLLAFLSNPFASKPEQTQDESRKAIDRIQVSPEITEIFEGQRVAFSAIGLDALGNPISGVKFTWSCYDLKAGQGSPISEGGVFMLIYPSDYQITEKAARKPGLT